MPHYREHIEAIIPHLPEGLRGDWLEDRDARSLPKDDIVLVAGYQDIERAHGHRVVYVEHGAGQTYLGNAKAPGHYHGSEHPENVIGYICPRQDVADAWNRPAVAVGSPVCDAYPLSTENEQPVATITFHWDCKILPETRSALEHYVFHLARIVRLLRDEGYIVLGHHHPRDKRLPRIWDKLQVQQATVRQVRSLTDLLIADNTSLAYEMLYLRRKVITLNAPWYRRDVHHGLRFWDHIPGAAVDTPQELMDIIPDGGTLNTEVAQYTYGRWCSDGGDGERAAAWLTMLTMTL